MESRSLRARSLSVIFGVSLVAAGCGSGVEDAGPSVTVARTSTPAPTVEITTTTTEPTTTEEEEETTTTEAPTTLAFSDDEDDDGNDSGGNSGGKGIKTGGSNSSGSSENEGQFEGDQPPEDITNPTTTTTTIPTTTEAQTDTTAGETTSTIATTTTIDPFAPFEGLEVLTIPHSDAQSAMSLQLVNIQCNNNGATPQIKLSASSSLEGVEQRVSFYGPSGAAYIASDTVTSGETQTFGNWLTAPVTADSFDWVAICSQPSWKVLVEISDSAGGFFSGIVDATISG